MVAGSALPDHKLGSSHRHPRTLYRTWVRFHGCCLQHLGSQVHVLVSVCIIRPLLCIGNAVIVTIGVQVVR